MNVNGQKTVVKKKKEIIRSDSHKKNPSMQCFKEWS